MIAESGFNGLHVDRFLLEFDTERAGGFEPLRHVPRARPSCSASSPPSLTRSRPGTTSCGASKKRPSTSRIDQLALGPQCGFQSAANRDGASMGIDAEKRKMELIAEVAREVWK